MIGLTIGKQEGLKEGLDQKEPYVNTMMYLGIIGNWNQILWLKDCYQAVWIKNRWK